MLFLLGHFRFQGGFEGSSLFVHAFWAEGSSRATRQARCKRVWVQKKGSQHWTGAKSPGCMDLDLE